MVNIQLMKKWIKALRSGKYRQTKEWLKKVTPGGHVAYCCLGLYCHISKNAEWKKNKNEYNDNTYTYMGKEDCLPGSLRKELGISGLEEYQLIYMNDSKGASFKDIAKYLEDKYVKKCS